MKLARQYWLQAILGLCTMITIGLILWPANSGDPAPTPTPERYAGPDIQTRKGGRMPGFAIRLRSGTGEASAAPQPIEALPVLVGIAGRRAYLRSATTGEVERVTIGQEIDGWRLVSVGARSASLRGPSGDRRIEMFSASGAQPAAAPLSTMGDPSQSNNGG